MVIGTIRNPNIISGAALITLFHGLINKPPARNGYNLQEPSEIYRKWTRCILRNVPICANVANSLAMRIQSGDRLADAVREMLIVADALGLSETSIHLNAALVTLDGKGLAPDEKRRRDAIN